MRKFLILFILVIAFNGYGWLDGRCFCEIISCKDTLDINASYINMLGTVIFQPGTMYFDDIQPATCDSVTGHLGSATNPYIVYSLPQWVYKYRTDTIYVTQMDASNGRNVALLSSACQGTENTNLYLKLDTDGEFWWYDLDEVTCDSALIDSINWQMYIVATNTDTILLGNIDPLGDARCHYVSFITTDTIIKSANTGCWDTTVVYNKTINKSNKRYFPYVCLLNTSSYIMLTRLILYYESWNQHYGIPQ